MTASVASASHLSNETDPPLLDRLSRALSRNSLLVGEAIDPRYQEDRRDRYSARPRFVVRPGSTEEVAACLAACNEFAQPLVVQGGRTGLSGGHRIADGEAVLSTERLTTLGEVQPETRTILASAGTPLQTVQEAADLAGFQFGVDIGARGTATIGGNVATNAGGIRVLRSACSARRWRGWKPCWPMARCSTRCAASTRTMPATTSTSSSLAAKGRWAS